MNASKLYVPDPQKWVDFFGKISKGSLTLNQSGAGRKLSVMIEIIMQFKLQSKLFYQQNKLQLKLNRNLFVKI